MNEGMPMHRNPFEKGRLIIKFDVKFPESINVDQVPALEKVLPPRKEAIVPDDAEEHDLVEFNPTEYEQRRRREVYDDDDDDDMPGGQRVQCASH
jgi:DnaJ family protein A protein 1